MYVHFFFLFIFKKYLNYVPVNSRRKKKKKNMLTAKTV